MARMHNVPTVAPDVTAASLPMEPRIRRKPHGRSFTLPPAPATPEAMRRAIDALVRSGRKFPEVES